MIASLRDAARLQPAERRRLSLSIALSLGTVLAAAGLLATSGYLISRAAQRPEILELTAAITAVRGFAVARAALRYAERLVSHDLALRVLSRLRAGFYTVLAPLGPTALRGRGSGELLSRFVADVDSLQDLYLRALAPPVTAVLVIAAVTLTAWLMLPASALVIAGCLLAAASTVPLLAGMLATSAGRRQAAARAALTTDLVEALDGSVELAVAGRAADRVRQLHTLGKRLSRISRRDAISGAASTTLSSLLTGATILAILLVTVPAVHDRTLSPVLLAALVLLALGAFEGLAPLPAAARSLSGCAQSAARLGELRSLEPAVRDPEHPRPCPLPASGPAAASIGPAAQALTLDHVSFAYPGELPTVREATYTFELGCRVVITGSSGAGKTTLAQLLNRFLDPTAGRVSLGGLDLRELALDDIRRTVVLAAQDAHVFTTSVRENVRLARTDATELDLWNALTTVQLADWVRSLPDGIDTLVGEDGDLLSGGERQRLTIARALVSDARFLILDEPTAQLDERTASELLRAVELGACDRGLIVISHRAEGLDGFDAVLALREGRLI